MLAWANIICMLLQIMFSQEKRYLIVLHFVIKNIELSHNSCLSKRYLKDTYYTTFSKAVIQLIPHRDARTPSLKLS